MLPSHSLTYSSVTLRQPDISPAKRVIWDQQRIKIQDTGSKGEHHTSPGNPTRGMLFYGLVWSCCKGSIHWRKLKVGSIVTFRWPSYSSLPLVELLLGDEESILPARVKQYHFLSEMQGMALPVGVGVVWCVEWHVRERSLFQPPDSIFNVISDY